MKKILILLLTLSSSSFFAQEYIPDGWDKIYLEGEVAYMNNLNGEISTKLPKGVAKPRRVTTNTVSQNYANASSDSQVYRIKKGDTFSKIAREHNMSLSELYSLNSLSDYNNLEIGQEVIISGSANSSKSKYHTVKKKETLYSIAQNYGISINELKSLNGIDSNFISVGQRLIIR